MTDIRRAELTEQRPVLETLAEAFFEDPVHAWIFEDESVRRDELPTWFGHMIDMIPIGGHVDVSVDLSSAAIWHAPAPVAPSADGARPDELPPIARHLVEVLDTDLAFDKLTKMSPLMELHPHEPHWYLAVLGSVPRVQGKGQGSDLLQHQLAICDATAVPAYLESSNPRNVPLYARHGFEVFETIELDEGGPELALMWREPRTS